MNAGPKRESKKSHQEEASKRIQAKFRSVEEESKTITVDKAASQKEPRRHQKKKPKRRRNPGGEESASNSQDRNSTANASKQLKISKEKYSLNAQATKIIRKSVNDCSHGQDNTVKFTIRHAHKSTADEKKRQTDTLSDTVKRNNLKTTQNSKEIKDQLTHAVKEQAGSVGGGPLGSFVKKIAKVARNKRENELVSPLIFPPGSMDKKNTPNESERRKKMNAVPSQNGLPKLGDSTEVKKLLHIPSKKLLQTDSVQSNVGRVSKQQNLNGAPRDRERSKPRDKSQDERKSAEELKRRAKSRGKRRPRPEPPAECEKIRENLTKLNTKSKQLVLRNVQRTGLSKRLNKPRRSKSSNDLLSEQLIKRVLGRSDSVNSKTHNEDQHYLEYKYIVGKDKKNGSHREALFKDKHPKKPSKEKNPAPKSVAKSGKAKSFKWSKPAPRPNSIPVKLKKILLPTPAVQSHPGKDPRDSSPSDRNRENFRDIHDKIQSLTSKLQKNYGLIPSAFLKHKSGQPLSSISHPKKDKKKARKTPGQRKKRDDEENPEDIPTDEQLLIDKEILLPKLSSEYNSNDPNGRLQYDSQHNRPADRPPSNSRLPHSLEVASPKRAENPQENSHQKKSVTIKDSISSDQKNSDRFIEDPKEHNHLISRLDLDEINKDPLSKENYERWMQLLNEFKKCEQNGSVDHELKELLMTFCDQTQKGLNLLIKKQPDPSNNTSRSPSPEQNEDSKRRKKPNLGIDVETINQNYLAPPQVSAPKETRSNSFQWLRAEFEQNLEELSKLLGGNNKDDTLKKIQDAIKLNEMYSNVFELRVSAIQDRYEAQKTQILEIHETEKEQQQKADLLDQLDDWYKAEMASMDSEKKKITKGWFTSIEAIRKIKRDIEITCDTKRNFGALARGLTVSRADDPNNIFNIISKSLASPSHRRREKERKAGRDPSPLASPNANSGFSHSKIISDPNLHSMKIKQAHALRKNEELIKSIDQLENSSKSKDPPHEQGRQLEISDNKLRIVEEIDEGLRLKPRDELNEVVKNTFPFRDNPIFSYGSPPNPSVNSSGLYNISPTSIKHPSKLTSSNKPRSTLKNDSAADEKSKAEDLIWIKDQGSRSNRNDAHPAYLASPAQVLQNQSVPPSSHKEERLEPPSSHSQPSGIHHVLFTPNLTAHNPLNESLKRELATLNNSELPKRSNTKAHLNEPEDYLNDLIQGIGFDSQMIKNDFEDKDGKNSHYGLDDFASMSDSDRGEASRKLLAVSDRRLASSGHNLAAHQLDTRLGEELSEKQLRAVLDKRAALSHEVDHISGQILDIIFTETISDIIQMLESENMDLEAEISNGNTHHIFHQDGGSEQGLGQGQMGDRTLRRGIRVNSNAIKEYLSMLTNYIKGSRPSPSERPRGQARSRPQAQHHARPESPGEARGLPRRLR